MELSQQIQNKLAQFQQMQQQLQLVAGQKQQIDFQVREMERTLEELAKIDDKTAIYKTIGSLLVKVENKESIIKELIEQKEEFTAKSKTMEKQLERFKAKVQELQLEIAQGMKPT